MADCGKGSAGYKGKFYVSIDDGATYDLVGSANSMELTRNMEPIEVTSFDSVDGNKEFLDGLKDWSLSVEAFYLEGDIGQIDLIASIDVGTVLKVEFRPTGDTVGNFEFVGNVLVKSWSINQGVSDAVAMSAELQGCGKPTRQAIV